MGSAPDGCRRLGSFDEWSAETRDAVRVGDTLKFEARVDMSPIYKVFQTFLSFADMAGRPGNGFSQSGQALKETKASATLVRGWIAVPDSPPIRSSTSRQAASRIPAWSRVLQPQYIVGSGESLEGQFWIVAQIAAILGEGENLSVIRVVRDAPPTPMELAAVNEMLSNFKEPAKEMGVDIDDSDINIAAPTVIVRPIAIYQ